MYGLKQVYKINKNLPFYKCKDLINNAKFAMVVDNQKEECKLFTTLKRKQAKEQVNDFLENVKLKQQGIRKGNYFIVLDNI